MQQNARFWLRALWNLLLVQPEVTARNPLRAGWPVCLRSAAWSGLEAGDLGREARRVQHIEAGATVMEVAQLRTAAQDMLDGLEQVRPGGGCAGDGRGWRSRGTVLRRACPSWMRSSGRGCAPM